MSKRGVLPGPSARLLTAALLCTGVLAACTDAATSPPLAARSRPGVLKAVGTAPLRYAPMTTASDELAKAIPGFGGAFVSNGVLHVYLTPSGNTPQGQTAARAAITRLFVAGGRPEMSVTFLPGRYSFVALRTWERALENHFRTFGVGAAQVDERENRFSIALPSLAAENGLRSELLALGIPSDAVALRITRSEVVPLVDLNDKVRPAGGGLRILALFNYNGAQYSARCTYGFNVQIADGSTNRYMVTNAHCVQPEGTFGGLTGAQVAQPDSNVTSLLGYVTVNPPAQAGVSGCAAGDVCRESDAVLVQANDFRFPASAWDFGGVARTTYKGTGPSSSGSTTISGRIAITDASTIFFAGDVLEKIGATTGWTAGTVTGTCVYGAVAGGGRMCNGVVAAGSNLGDSGSPVFWQDGSGRYHLMGILWGGTNVYAGHNSDEFYFSRWQGIKDDLSPYNDLLVAPATGGGSTCVPKPGGPPCPL